MTANQICRLGISGLSKKESSDVLAYVRTLAK